MCTYIRVCDPMWEYRKMTTTLPLMEYYHKEAFISISSLQFVCNVHAHTQSHDQSVYTNYIHTHKYGMLVYMYCFIRHTTDVCSGRMLESSVLGRSGHS